MRLKRLDLQGYKSFAARSEFAFDAGITAIVGPNGSGKSNIADAIRWVLGEQSYSTLRGKRTEDMIFAGSTQRARAGMAQASITLDNEDRCLPISYNEVTIERRAYRSGENEYWVNGNRVRLKDINDLLAAAGLSRRTYAVIGQGLVDAALSLNPEERRALFEEAAGITGHQSKRADALNRLRETTQNIIRVNDIINEIQPQLSRLHKQAEQATEHERVNRELHDMLFEWYGFKWHQVQQALTDAMAATKRQEKQVAASETDMERLERQINENRTRRNELRQQLSEWHRQSSHLHGQSEASQRELAIRQERHRQLESQREELSKELVPLKASQAGQAERYNEAQEELARLNTEFEHQRTQLKDLESQILGLQTRRKSLVADVTTHQNKTFHLSTQIANLHNRLDQINERRTAIAKERQTHQQVIEGHALKHAAHERDMGALDQTMASLRQQIRDGEDSKARYQQSGVEKQDEQAKLQTRISQTRRELQQLQTRYDSLSRLREDMTDYYGGVRALLGSQSERRVPGLLGTVASLVKVETSLEKAIEIALGAHLQDIVAQDWPAAQKAIEHLKKDRAGRATFLPLDSLRPPPALQVPRQPGVIGLALDLVSFDAALRPVFELLLGHILIVEDLNTAHQIFKQLRGGFQIVTPDGEVVRSTGAISGGVAQNQQRGLLSREREWRELPVQIEGVAGQIDELERQSQAIADAARDLQRRVQQEEQRRNELVRKQEETRQQRVQLQQTVAEVIRESDWRKSLLSKLDDESTGLDARERSLLAEQDRSQAHLAESQSNITEVNRQLAELENDPLQEETGDMRTQVALAERAIDSQGVVLENHRQALRELDSQIEAKERRISSLSSDIETLLQETSQISARSDSVSNSIGELSVLIQPAETELAAIEQSLSETDQRQTALRSRLHSQQTLYAQISLDAQRRRDEVAGLHRQMEEDLGLVETDLAEDVEAQQPLPLKPLVAHLPTITQLSPNLESEIRRLRAQRQRLGTINPNAPAEYTELMERYTFLSNQASDLQQAATSLQTIISELDQLITRDFSKTFRAIAAEFKNYFATLFGGGSAQLLLTNPDDPLNSGIEIVARPPGKRQQSLNLLSGGERALAAAALVFSILRVSPTPFCVLDEVDAMLDEANVGRFRDTLRSLATGTQFILITHNRRTVEAAQTIYGISMNHDKTSVVVSLKLEEVSHDSITQSIGSNTRDSQQ